MPHFESFGSKIKKRGAQGQHWTNLRACAFLEEFREEKIIWIELANRGRFAYSDEEVYLLNSAYFMKPPAGYSGKALTALLNSTPIYLFMRNVSQTIGAGNRWIKATVESFPIPPIRAENRRVWDSLEAAAVKIIGTAPDLVSDDVLSDIDALVCELYELTPQQIDLIRKFQTES